MYDYGWDRRNWFHRSAGEHRAVREAVGVFDQTSFSKLLVQGRDAERVLNRLSTASCAVPVGKIVYTQFLNALGGIVADLTVTRLATDQFMVVTAAFTHTHVEAWIRNAFDTKYIPLAFAYGQLAPSGFIGEMGRPRTFGVSAGVGF